MKKQKSPCINHCDFSGSKGWCLGCGRTRNECQKWQAMKPFDINNLRKVLGKRMNQIRTECAPNKEFKDND
ncbi:DUF1289 domain-containing protein [uncultured Vibrio sp.]|uniref:DUF1289 domain-containing protein n=1 Tax=uncultured Vibrio sp. TaxID=114054 RepID=UPI0025F995C9|nr:DUF1289 domain-containing protein [uncultured Vibrio sp.]